MTIHIIPVPKGEEGRNRKKIGRNNAEIMVKTILYLMKIINP